MSTWGSTGGGYLVAAATWTGSPSRPLMTVLSARMSTVEVAGSSGATKPIRPSLTS